MRGHCLVERLPECREPFELAYGGTALDFYADDLAVPNGGEVHLNVDSGALHERDREQVGTDRRFDEPAPGRGIGASLVERKPKQRAGERTLA
jgi:hypothetical protein